MKTDKHASLSFILGSYRGFLSDLQKIDFCSAMKVTWPFVTAWGCAGASFIPVAEAQTRDAVQILMNQEISGVGLKEFRQVLELDPLKMLMLTS